ncbi:MAG: translocation/assembly module TamB domain-containing protein, partial [Pyrinomonadaceae bacterium]
LAAIVIAGGAFLLFVLLVLTYRLGYIDSYIANQVKGTMAEYGIRMEIGAFETKYSPRTVEMRDVKLYDAKTGEQLGKIDRLIATVRFKDLFALNLRRNIDLEALDVDKLEVWVKFDGQGNSNFRNITLPAANPNKRILFSYATAKIKLNNALIHYGDELHRISGEARNLVATVEPDDPKAPVESAMNRITFATTNSTFVYNDRPVNNIDISAKGRINQTRAEIEDLTLRSPLAEAHLKGTMDDWRALRYRMELTSTVDLTQASDILQTGATLRGSGTIHGTVTGEGSKYQVTGDVSSDALAADDIRLQKLQVTASGSGAAASYEANGKAVAELLTAGDFQLNQMQMIGGIRGTGTDFRWFGELRAAAAKVPGGATIAGLILYDAVAEKRDAEIDANARQASAGSVDVTGTKLSGVQANGIQMTLRNGVTTVKVNGARANEIVSKTARVYNVQVNGINVVDRAGSPTTVTTGKVQIAGIDASSAKIGSMNIAGVRLSIYQGRIEGRTDDINVGDVAISQTKDNPAGKVTGVKVGHPVFVVEPSGRYRASADLSLGGGVLGSVDLGAARADLVATTDQIQLNNFTAEIMNGRAAGNMTIATSGRGSSHVTGTFENLDLAKLTSLSGRIIPLTGQTNGSVDLAFAGTDLKNTASGKINATFVTQAGNDVSGRTPLNGELALRADRGVFDIERAILNTEASQLTATGRFSFSKDDSNLNLKLASTDASELQRLFAASGLANETNDMLEQYEIGIGGALAFDGTLTGRLTDPSVNGKFSVGSFQMQQRDLGAVSAALNVTPELININDGKLAESDGGGITFSLNAPRTGENNIALDVTLDRVNGGNLFSVIPKLSPPTRALLLGLHSDLSGTAKISGLPNAASGNADLRLGPGTLNVEPFDSIVARGIFSGTTVNVEQLSANFQAGKISANGSFDWSSRAFKFAAAGDQIALDRVRSFALLNNAPRFGGTVNVTARATGADFNKFNSYDINFDGSSSGLTINEQTAGELTLTGRTVNGLLSVNLTTGLLGQPQVVAATVNLADDKLPATLDTSLNNANLSPLIAIFLPPNSVVMTGRATGTLHAAGNLNYENAAGEDDFGIGGMRGAANFTQFGLVVQDISLNAVTPLTIEFSPTEIDFKNTQLTGPGSNLTISGTKSLREGGQNNLSVNGSLNLRVLNGISPNYLFSGAADVAVRVTGSHETPRLTGSANLNNASFSTFVANERLTLGNIKGRAIFNFDQIQLDSLTGTLGGGQVAVSGGVLLDRFTPTQYRFTVRGTDVTVPFPTGFRTTADANLEVSGSRQRNRLSNFISGTVNVSRAEYRQNMDLADLVNQRTEGSLTEGGSGDSSSSLIGTTQLDLRIEGRDALTVQNNLGDLVGSVSLRAAGPIDDPIISGRITATRGTLLFRRERYEIVRGLIDLPARRAADPILNIQAEAEIKGYNVVVNFSGPLSQPLAAVRSEPALAQADVIALITTGNLATNETNTSALASTGLGTAANLLADSLINAPVQKATDKLFGLNRFEIEPVIGGSGGSSPTARLTVGRQINRNLSITYSTNVSEADRNQVVALEYRVSNRLSFVAQYEQGPVNGLATRNNNFSFEIRFKKRF